MIQYCDPEETCVYRANSLYKKVAAIQSTYFEWVNFQVIAFPAKFYSRNEAN